MSWAKREIEERGSTSKRGSTRRGYDGTDGSIGSTSDAPPVEYDIHAEDMHVLFEFELDECVRGSTSNCGSTRRECGSTSCSSIR